jgi:hypothetical protein
MRAAGRATVDRQRYTVRCHPVPRRTGSSPEARRAAATDRSVTRGAGRGRPIPRQWKRVGDPAPRPRRLAVMGTDGPMPSAGVSTTPPAHCTGSSGRRRARASPTTPHRSSRPITRCAPASTTSCCTTSCTAARCSRLGSCPWYAATPTSHPNDSSPPTST